MGSPAEPRTRAGMLGALALLLPTILTTTAGASTARPPQTAWVATAASVSLPGSTLTPVDLRSRTVERAVTVGSTIQGTLPAAMAFTKGGAALLVVDQGTDTLHEIDPVTGRVGHSVTVGVEPDAVAVAPGGTHHQGLALVANLNGDSVTPVDLGTWKAGAPIAVGTEPVAVVVAPGGTAFVADFGSNAVTPIDLATMTAGPPIAVGPSPETLAAAGGQVLVGNFGDRTLTPIDAATRHAGPAVGLPVDPTAIAVTASGATAYVSGGGGLVPVTVAGLVVGPLIALKGSPQAVALSRDDKTAWVALQAGSLVPVALTTGTAGRPIHVGGHPSALVIAPG